MRVTDVQIHLCDGYDDRLRAYCAIVIDGCFVVHNIRIVEKGGGLLVAMPSRKIIHKCPSCEFKNPIDANYCSHCGTRLPMNPKGADPDQKVHFDVAHPINPNCRKAIEDAVLGAYYQQLAAIQGKAS